MCQDRTFAVEAPPARRFGRFFYLPKLRNGNALLYLERRFDAKRVRLTKEEELLQRFRSVLYPIEYSDFTYPDDADTITRRRVIKSPSLLIGIARYAVCAGAFREVDHHVFSE
jgi:hypothetical protein